MYKQDSLFTLSTGEMGAVLFVSACLTIAVLLIGFRLMTNRSLWLRVLIAAFLFYLFVWLSPQIYYVLYVFILEGLSLKLVVQTPPTPKFLLQLVTFSDRANLSFHGQGVLGLMLLGLAVIRPRLPYPFSVR